MSSVIGKGRQFERAENDTPYDWLSVGDALWSAMVKYRSESGRPEPKWKRHFIREWREYRNMTQEDVADNLGISRALLSKVEGNRGQYMQWLVEALADVYQCSIADLLERNPQAANPANDVVDMIRAASPADQERAANLIRALLASAPRGG